MNPIALRTLLPGLGLAVLLTAPVSAQLARTAPGAGTRARSISLPQSFIEDEQGYLMLGDGLAVSLQAGGMLWLVSDTGAPGTQGSLVTIEPVGARSDAAPVGEDLLPGEVSHFRGPPSAWRAGRRTVRTVRYPELWPGIDLTLEARGQTLKGTYVVAPGADARAIRMRHHGADAVTIDSDGQLVVHTQSGDIIDAAPVAWQQIDGSRRDVPVAFATEPAADGAVDVSFALGPHDPSAALLIDPAVIVQAGFLGGAKDENPAGMAVDDDGNVYVAGWTLSDEATFPVLVGPELVWEGAASTTQGDAFVAKLDPSGETLIYAGFIGGTQYDFARSIAVDSLGRAYVGGHTGSSETAGFPVTGGPDLTQPGGIDGWVARVSADGSTLEYCGYIGGNDEDRVFGVAVDDSFRMSIVGRFESIPSTLPLAIGPYLLPPGGPTDSFIARLNPTGTAFEYCGYLGGSSLEDITNVAVDDAGGAWFTGWTGSSDFPVVGALGGTYSGGADIVVGRVAPDGTALTSSGYLGSVLSDYPSTIALDAAGAVYVCGVTTDAATFPAVVGPNLVPANATEGFLTKIAADGGSIVWSGFTNTGFSAAGMIPDDDGSAWFLTSQTDSTPALAEPVLGRVASSGLAVDQFIPYLLPGESIGFFARVPAALTPGVTEFWCVGATTSDETVIPVVSGPDLTANGGKDVLLLRLQVADDPWTDLGFALAGTHGDPVLTGTGTLGPLSPLTLTLDNALESTTAWLVFSVGAVYAPFKGGTMVPDLSLLSFASSLGTSPAGTLVLPATWPGGVPSGFSIYLQYWIQDPAAILGFAASNGLRGTTP